MKNKTLIFLGIPVLSVLVLIFIGPISQDIGYHDFADKREMLGVFNFNDVISNVLFLLFGVWGLMNFPKKQIFQPIRIHYFIFCLGVVLTGLGSAFYHLNPNNTTLVWDRVPMTIAFMSFFSATVVDYINIDMGRKILIPALIFGIASVLYWHITEGTGQGDLRPYAIVQFLPMILIPLMIVMYEPESIQERFIIWGLVLYGLSKIFEALDKYMFYVSSEIISGHSVKHVFAAIGSFFIMKMFFISFPSKPFQKDC